MLSAWVDTMRPIAMARSAAEIICNAEPGLLKEAHALWGKESLTGGVMSAADEGSLEPSRDSVLAVVLYSTPLVSTSGLLYSAPWFSMSELLRGSAGLICSTAMTAGDLATVQSQVMRQGDTTMIAAKDRPWS